MTKREIFQEYRNDQYWKSYYYRLKEKDHTVTFIIIMVNIFNIHSWLKILVSLDLI